jgi:hypothetical protein
MRGGFTPGVLALACLAVVAGSAACASSADDDAASDTGALSKGSRNWSAHPAIVEIDDATEVYAISDVHGAYVQFGRLLQDNGLVRGFDPNPDHASAAEWTGKTALLIVVGDLIDKGVESLGVIDLVRSLEAKAARAGGRVVTTVGNHEAEFFADPKNDKATRTTSDGVGFAVELKAKGIDPKDVASGKDAAGRGAWLANLPFGVRVKKWFFCHSGNTNGDSIKKLSKRLEDALDGSKGWDDKDITGDDSILEAQQWYGGKDGDKKKMGDFADALGVNHLVFGHDPGALDDRGRILSSAGDILVKLDVNIGLPSESKALVSGALLHIKIVHDGPDKAETLEASGTEKPLF